MNDFGTPQRGRPDHYGIKPLELAKYGGIAVAVVIAAVFVFFWFSCRIDVSKGQFVPLLRKTGKDISNDQILATSRDFKGPQFEILREGRHFLNPYRWYWPRPMTATVIPELTVGVIVRRYGEPLALGQVVVDNDKQKGILSKTIGPGRHYLNLWAYDVEMHDMVKIEPGYRGVVTRLVSRISGETNVFVVKEGERGTQPFLLPPGTHPEFSNPYVYTVTPIDTRSQKFEMAGDYGITFPSKYGFDIKVEGTIEWAPDEKMLPKLFVKYVDKADLRKSGGIDNIQRKIILPYARSFFRLIGGQHRAVDYITGDTRILVQRQVEARLRESCQKQGVTIRSFVIRATEPPRRIREQYERREIAAREIDRFSKEVETEIGSIVLKDGKEQALPGGTLVREGGRLEKVIKERQKDRESKFGQARSKIRTVIRRAEQYQKVEVTKGKKDLEVAKIRLEAAKDKAATTLAEGMAIAEVTVMKHKAEAQAVREKIVAFKTGENYAEYQLITKFAPGIKRILSNTEGLFADLFKRFSSTGR